jgi:RHS repeat-associated protein
VTNLLDDQGNATVSYGYDEFGETTVKGDEAFYNEIGYTGQIRDVNTGLYYCNARYYDPEDGRFVTQDTYRGEREEPDTLHLYVYCANDPLNYTDPTGHYRFSKTYSRNQSRNTYCLLKAIEKTYSVFSWVSIAYSIAAKAIWRVARKVGIKASFAAFKKRMNGNRYKRFKNGWYRGGYGKIRFRYGIYEKIKRTKFVFRTPLSINFYYKSKSSRGYI